MPRVVRVLARYTEGGIETGATMVFVTPLDDGQLPVRGEILGYAIEEEGDLGRAPDA